MIKNIVVKNLEAKETLEKIIDIAQPKETDEKKRIINSILDKKKEDNYLIIVTAKGLDLFTLGDVFKKDTVARHVTLLREKEVPLLVLLNIEDKKNLIGEFVELEARKFYESVKKNAFGCKWQEMIYEDGGFKVPTHTNIRPGDYENYGKFLGAVKYPDDRAGFDKIINRETTRHKVESARWYEDGEVEQLLNLVDDVVN